MTAFYLKYRPQKIKDLDLVKIRDELGKILKSKEVAHAFLFVGPKGTGKTSSARIVAKAVNCKRASPPAGGEPCNKCEVCLSITEGREMDLIEIDAASNRGIDDIRDLRQKIKLAPSRLKKKVYIIDEVHMLTNEAFNALLKTLEEPPAHALFVLCTTEPDKVPETIQSRCLILNFNKASQEEMVAALTKVVKGEKLTIKKQDLSLIAKNSEGSFRDGVKILELLATTGKRISSKRVTEVLEQGMQGKKSQDWLVMVYQGKTKEALEVLNQGLKEGLEVKGLMRVVIETLRDVLLTKLKVKQAVGQEYAEKFSQLNRLKSLTKLMMRAAMEIKGAAIESLPLELAVVEWGLKISDKESSQTPVRATVEPKKKLASKAGKLDLKTVEQKWSQVLEALRPHNHSLEALLRATKPTGFKGKFLILEVFYKFHKERLEAVRYRQLVEQVASKVLAAPVGIRFQLSSQTRKVTEKSQSHDNISARIDDDVIETAEEVFGVKMD